MPTQPPYALNSATHYTILGHVLSPIKCKDCKIPEKKDKRVVNLQRKGDIKERKETHREKNEDDLQRGLWSQKKPTPDSFQRHKPHNPFLPIDYSDNPWNSTDHFGCQIEERNKEQKKKGKKEGALCALEDENPPTTKPIFLEPERTPDSSNTPLAPALLFSSA